MAHSMEQAETKQKRIAKEIETDKKKFDGEIQKLDEGHTKNLCIYLFLGTFL